MGVSRLTAVTVDNDCDSILELTDHMCDSAFDSDRVSMRLLLETDSDTLVESRSVGSDAFLLFSDFWSSLGMDSIQAEGRCFVLQRDVADPGAFVVGMEYSQNKC